MHKENNTPKLYQPLELLEVCSNQIIGGGAILGIDNFAPLRIGDGIVPAVWLYARVDKENWTAIIKKSESFHSLITIQKDLEKREITINIDETTVLRAKMTSYKKCLVDKIDLRPVGFNLFGEGKNFQVANSSFSGNTFNGISFMVGMGSPSE